jgi:transposase
VKLLSCLLPDATCVRLETCSLDQAQSIVTLTLHTRQRRVACPLCGRRAKRVHSRYERTLADLPWGAYAVSIRLKIRRLFCDNAQCKHRIFAERVPSVVAPWARKTTRLTGRLTAMGVALGGAAGARLGRRLGLATSRNTLLRLIRRAPMPSIATPSALGVDDWALRKGQSYGTVLVDLEQHRPVALLPDRAAETLADWLRAHPGVTVISRDRAGAYAKGARQGAPAAIQVADRFHLLQNLAEALEVVFSTHHKHLDAVGQPSHMSTVAEPDGAPEAPSAPPTEARALAAERQEHRVAVHRQVCSLSRQGWSKLAMARHLGIGRATVFRYLNHEELPERKSRRDRGRSQLDQWRQIVLDHWKSGRRNGRWLFGVLRQQHGYRGSYATLARYLQRLRATQGELGAHPPTKRSRGALNAAPQRVLTPRTAAWLVLRRMEKRSEEDQALLADLRGRAPELDVAVALAAAFASLIRDHAPERLDLWLQRAGDSMVRQLQGFAKHLSADYDAVRAAAELAWSNGQVEGQINRLKTTKRQMYGRAGLDLLGRRFLLAA